MQQDAAMVEVPTGAGERPGAAPRRAPRGPRHRSVDGAIQAAMEAGEGETVTLGEILDVLALRSIGPVLFIPALIAVLPLIGALPGVTWTMAGLILLISIQMIFTHNSHWAPDIIRKLSMSRSLLQKSLGWARKPARWIDRVTRARLAFLVHRPWARLIGVAIFLMAVVMFIVSVIPGAVVAPGLVVLILSIALITEDGLVGLVGLGLSGGAIALTWTLIY